VRLILARAKAGRDPGVALRDDVASDRRSSDRARARAALHPMREDHEAAAPVRRHLDEVVSAAQRAASADRRARRLGARPGGQWRARHDEYLPRHQQDNERVPRLHAGNQRRWENEGG